MCLFNTPSIPAPQKVDMPARKDVISSEDTTATTAAREAKRKGYASTVATSGSGLVDTPVIKKVTLGS